MGDSDALTATAEWVTNVAGCMSSPGTSIVVRPLCRSSQHVEGLSEVFSLLSAWISFISIVILSVAWSATDVILNTQTCTQYHTRTHARSASCEWWSAVLKGWGIRKWPAWWIKGLHDNQGVCVHVCVRKRDRQKEISPQKRVQYWGFCFFFFCFIWGHSVRLSLCLHVSLMSPCMSFLHMHIFKCKCNFLRSTSS